MLPTLREGDLVLVSYRRPVRPGDVVVAVLADGTVAVKRAVERRTTEHLRGLEGQHRAHAGAQCAQGAGLGTQLGIGGLVDRNTDDHTPTVVERGHGGVVSSGGSFGQRSHPDHSRAGQGRRHRRG